MGMQCSIRSASNKRSCCGSGKGAKWCEMAKSAGGQGFGRVTSQQAEVQVGAALVHAVSEAIVTQAFKSAVQENGLQKFEIDRDAWLHSKKSTQNYMQLHTSVISRQRKHSRSKVNIIYKNDLKRALIKCHNMNSPKPSNEFNGQEASISRLTFLQWSWQQNAAYTDGFATRQLSSFLSSHQSRPRSLHDSDGMFAKRR